MRCVVMSYEAGSRAYYSIAPRQLAPRSCLLTMYSRLLPDLYRISISQDNVGAATNEDWFMKSLMRAICEHALVGPNQASLDLNQERMNKYSYLINDYGDSKERREDNCLIAIQQLIHKLEHPRGNYLFIYH